MSDGMSDANAVGRITDRLDSAAWELREAIERAVGGHRGLTVNICDTVNEVILSTGYKLVPAEKASR